MLLLNQFELDMSDFQGIRFRQVAELMNPMCFSDWFILRRTLAHFDSHDREKLLNCVLRAVNRQTSPDLREAPYDSYCII